MLFTHRQIPKLWQVLSLSTLFLVANSAKSFAQYLGGNGNGHSDLAILPSSCSVVGANPFLGGNADGHAELSIIPTACYLSAANPFTGGNADGHSDMSIIPTICYLSTANPFTGGNADGHSDMSIIPTICYLSTANPFLGGNADGHSNLKIEPSPCVVPLPVELLSFEVRCDKREVKLKWATASETNNDYFTIERSVDGAVFKIIGTVNGAGTSSQTINYSFNDTDPYKGTAYYRLKQTDFDGKFEYSPLVSIACGSDVSNAPINISIYPNPGRGDFIIEGMEENTHLTIFNVLGENILSQMISSSNAKMSLMSLSAGVYFIHFNSVNGNIVKKIIVNK